MIRFLSPEWFDAMSRALEMLSVPPGIELRVGQVVEGGPDGDVAYQFMISEGRCRIEREISGATVVLHSTYDTTLRIACGHLDAGHGVLHGDVRVEGDPLLLVAAAPALVVIGPAVAAVEITEPT